MRGGRAIAALAVLGGCHWAFGISSISPADAPDGPTPDAPLAPTLWDSVSGGFLHTCGIRLDQTLWCWGRNDAGQLALPATDVEEDVPVQVGTDLWLSVSASSNHTCGLKTDHTLWCWGEDQNDELGVAGAPSIYVPVQVMGTWKAVATGAYDTCAIDDTSALQCWGNNDVGQIGNMSVPQGNRPDRILVDGGASWSAVTVSGNSAACGLHTDGSLWCWGYNGYGQVGVNSPLNFNTPQHVGTDTYLEVVMGTETACAVRTDGLLRCWGEGDQGEIGNDNVANLLVPTAVSGDDAHWKSVAVGGSHVCGLHQDDTLWCWGSNSMGELASDTQTDRFKTIPKPVTNPSGTWLAVAAGDAHTCAIAADHQLWCAGRNGGALGAADGGSRTAPVHVGTATTIATGGYSTCAIDGGALACWGYNSVGMLGNGTAFNTQTAVAVPGAWSAVATSAGHTCGVTMTGGMLCWGQNNNGELGNNTLVSSEVPTAVAPTPGTWTAIAVNADSCGVEGGDVYCWGTNVNGQAGPPIGAPYYHEIPTLVGATGWTEVGTGTFHTCAINGTGVHCWGSNGLGQLGVPGPDNPNPSVASVLQGTVFDQLAVGGHHACARADGQAYCWGYDGNGELGNGSTQGGGPFLLGGAWAQLSAGDFTTCGVKTDHTLWCWGANAFGQLGIGTRTEHHEPMQVGTDSDWKLVSATSGHTCAVKQNGDLYCWGRNFEGEVGDGQAWRSTLSVVH